MYSIKRKTVIIVVFFVFMHGALNVYAQDKIDAQQILEKADESRAPWADFSMIATIENISDKNNKTRHLFHVFIKDHVKSLVCYLEPIKQRGNLLLMVGDDLWFYVYRTQRPVRITPIQKLTGGASYGDVSRLSWSIDYIVESVSERELALNENLYDCLLLNLKARSKSATYNKIDLYVDKKTYRPLKAVVYLFSGKKMKTIYYEDFSRIAGRIMNTKVKIVDHLSDEEKTVMRFSEVKIKKTPERYFIKSNLQGLYGDILQ